jgi:hypothetical protein
MWCLLPVCTIFRISHQFQELGVFFTLIDVNKLGTELDCQTDQFVIHRTSWNDLETKGTKMLYIFY